MLLLGTFTMIGQSCDSNSNHDEHAKEEHEDEDHHGHSEEEEVHLTKAQLKLANIELGKLKPMDLSKTIQTIGRVILPSQHRASVNAVKGGQVSDMFVKPGEKVEKGQVLARLRDPYFIKVQQQYLDARAQLKYLKARYERKKKLYEGEVGAKQELQKAQAAYKSKLSHLERHATELRMLNLDPEQMKDSGDIKETVPLLAPISGIIQKVKVRIGQYLEPRSTLFTLLEREHLRLKMMIYEKDIAKIAVGQRVYANRVDGQGAPVEGEIEGINHGMNDQQQAVEAYASFDTVPRSFKPGMSMEVQIVTNKQDGDALPNSGTVRHEQSQYIFYTTQPEKDTIHFKREKVKAGITEAQFTAISLSDQLPANASVVTHNAHYLLREMMESAGGGHSH